MFSELRGVEGWIDGLPNLLLRFFLHVNGIQVYEVLGDLRWNFTRHTGCFSDMIVRTTLSSLITPVTGRKAVVNFIDIVHPMPEPVLLVDGSLDVI